jgi:hypothetical protein
MALSHPFAVNDFPDACGFQKGALLKTGLGSSTGTRKHSYA